MRNLVKQYLEDHDITTYAFWRRTGLSQGTAYKIVNDPSHIPGGAVLKVICETYKIQPGQILIWEPEDEKQIA